MKVSLLIALIVVVLTISCSSADQPTAGPSLLVCLPCLEDPGNNPQADSLRISTLTFPFQEDSSFTTRDGEHTITLGVTLYGALTGPVQWSVVDEPGDALQSGTVPAPAPGFQTQFDVPGPLIAAQTPDTSRWIAYTHPGDLNQKALAFTVTATAHRPDGSAVESTPIVLHQHQKDVLRQEYVDFGITAILPARTQLKSAADFASRHFTFAELTDVDYSVAFLTNELISHLDDLRDSVGSALPATSGYRNPVHHRFHFPRPVGARIATRSNHQSGNAADIGVGLSQARFDLVKRRAIEVGLCVEPVLQSTLSHIHVDWRNGRRACPGGW